MKAMAVESDQSVAVAQVGQEVFVQIRMTHFPPLLTRASIAYFSLA